VLDDADMPIWDQVMPLTENEIARTLDAAIFFGTNAPGSWPDDIATAAASANNTETRGTAADEGGVAADISLLLSDLESDGFDANTVVASRVYRGFLRNARNSLGERLGEVSQSGIYGLDFIYPMRGLWPSGSGEAELFALDSAEFVLGIRQDITWKVLTEAVIQDNTGTIVYNLAQQDMVALRVVMRVGWQVANTINYDQADEDERYPAAVMLSA
jgi:hypothetical protein